MELEKLLDEGEEVLFETRRRRPIPFRIIVLSHAIWLATAAVMFLGPMLYVVASSEAKDRTWSIGWRVIEVKTADPALGARIPGPLATLPNPIFKAQRIPVLPAFLVFLLLMEGARQAAWRSGRYVLTTRRFLWGTFPFAWSYARTGGERVQDTPRGILIDGLRGLSKTRLLRGFASDDIPALERALERFDPTTPTTRGLARARRRLLAWAALAVALLGAAVSVAIYFAIAPALVTVAITRTAAPPAGYEVVAIEVSCPTYGRRRILFHNVARALGDGVELKHASTTVTSNYGPFRDRISGSWMFRSKTPPRTLHLEGELIDYTERRAEIPFTADLAAGASVTLEVPPPP